MEHPPVGEWEKRVVEMHGQRLQLLLGRTTDVGTAVAEAGQQRSVLLENHAVINEECPVQFVRQGTRHRAILTGATEQRAEAGTGGAAEENREGVHATAPVVSSVEDRRNAAITHRATSTKLRTG